MLWAALAFAAGIAVGVHAWRPPLWWFIAWIVFASSSLYWLRRRARAAFMAGLATMFLLGALLVQVRVPSEDPGSGLLQFADGTEVIVTAHVTKEGMPQEDVGGGFRQRLEVETEQITRENEASAVKGGLRVNIYQPLSKSETDQDCRFSIRPLYLRRTAALSRQTFFAAQLPQPGSVRLPGILIRKRNRRYGLNQGCER